MDKLAVIILAAGSSSRLGHPKQLVTLHHSTLLRHTAQMACELTSDSICILGYDGLNISSQLDGLPIKSCQNPNWQQGMGSSIAYGVRNLKKNTQAVLILLCDQWQLTLLDLKNMVTCWQQSREKIIASLHFQAQQPVIGVPAIFPRNYFKQLRQLRKTGAHKLLLENKQNLVTVELPNARFDLDTPQDLDYLRKSIKYKPNSGEPE